MFRGARACLSDGGSDGGFHLRRSGAGRQVGFNDGDFALLFFGQLVPAAFGELLHRLVPLFHQRLQDAELFRRLERAHLLDLFVLQRRFHHPQHAEPELFPGFHRRRHVRLDFVDEFHGRRKTVAFFLFAGMGIDTAACPV